jgi:hypothetical protein
MRYATGAAVEVLVCGERNALWRLAACLPRRVTAATI